jgi:hypothetical protein
MFLSPFINKEERPPAIASLYLSSAFLQSTTYASPTRSSPIIIVSFFTTDLSSFGKQYKTSIGLASKSSLKYESSFCKSSGL